MAYSNSFIHDVGYMVNQSVDNFYRPRIIYDKASSEYSCSSDTQSSITTTGVMSPDTTMQEDVHEYNGTGKPYLEITEEPADEFRFRYQSEMQGAHGAILGKSSDKHRKTFPSVKLHNFNGVGRIRCTLATASGHRSVHAHRLVAKLQQDKEKEDPHDIVIGPECYEATFQNMVIIHIEKKKVAEVLEQKIKTLLSHRFLNIPMNSKLTDAVDREIKDQVKREAAEMDMNQVSLKFEALVESENHLIDICPAVYTVPINNLKSHLRGKLKICRIDKHISSCRGGEEVFIFVEKVAKQNIKVKFYELDSDEQEIWFDYAKFGENDVHHQYGIVFRTPPYRTPDITRNAHVFLRLERPSDGGLSDPIEFQYKPDHLLKRRRASSDLPIEDLRLSNKNVASTPHLKSPWRPPDTTGDYIPDEMVQKYIGNEFIYDDFNFIFDEISTYDQIEENTSLPSNPSINDILKTLPTPEAEELVNCLSNFSSSGDLKEYTKAAVEGGLLPESTMITTDGIKSMLKQRTCTIGNLTFHLPSLRRITQSDFINKGLQALNRAKRREFDKHKFSIIVKKFFTYSFDEKENRVLHLVSHEDTEQTLVQFIDFIVQHGLEYKSELVNIQNLDQQTPLHIAVMEGLSSAVSKLMSSHLPDPNKKDKDNKTPLHYAVLYANHCGDKGLKNLQTIIDSRSCNINEICDDGTALHLAIREKNIKILDMLLQHPELNVNICAGSSRETALHIAVESLEIKTVKNLVSKCKKYGKELRMDLKNAAGQTPRNLCTMHEQDEDEEICAKAEKIASLFNEDPDVTLLEDDDLEIINVRLCNNSLNYSLENSSKRKNSNSSSSDVMIIKSVTPEPIDLEIQTEEEDILVGYNEDTGIFDVIALKELKAILDKDDQWTKLALLLGYKNFIDNFYNHESPTLMLLTYVERYGTNMDMDSDIVNTILHLLTTSKLTDAALVLERMLSRKRIKKKKKN